MYWSSCDEMAKPIKVSLGANHFTIDTGNLTGDTIAQFANGFLTISDAFGSAWEEPISSMPAGQVTAAIGAGSALK